MRLLPHVETNWWRAPGTRLDVVAVRHALLFEDLMPGSPSSGHMQDRLGFPAWMAVGRALETFGC